MRNLLAPHSLPGAEGIVSVATGSVQATMQLSAVIVEKIKHKHYKKESNFPLPSLTSALHPCSRPLEFIQPLATRAETWQAIPGVSEWFMGIIKRGYSLQFARRTPRFSDGKHKQPRLTTEASHWLAVIHRLHTSANHNPLHFDIIIIIRIYIYIIIKYIYIYIF